MQAAPTPTRRRTDPAPWPFAPLTEAQTAARLCQEAALRREAARTQHQRLKRARAAMAALAVCASLAACGGGGDDPNATSEPEARIPTPSARCAASAPAPCI
jgi:hypothetical protein